MRRESFCFVHFPGGFSKAGKLTGCVIFEPIADRFQNLALRYKTVFWPEKYRKNGKKKFGFAKTVKRRIKSKKRPKYAEKTVLLKKKCVFPTYYCKMDMFGPNKNLLNHLTCFNLKISNFQLKITFLKFQYEKIASVIQSIRSILWCFWIDLAANHAGHILFPKNETLRRIYWSLKSNFKRCFLKSPKRWGVSNQTPGQKKVGSETPGATE